MRIAVIGGGPGGLMFARLAAPPHRVDVFEQNPAGATYGFGVVLAEVALDILDGTDPALRARIAGGAEFQDRITVTHRGETIDLRGNPFLGIARVTLLGLMQANAQEAGARLHFGHTVRSVRDLDGYDMVVGADGVNSAIRTELDASFQAEREFRRNKWVWYATTKRLDAVGLVFQATRYGTFIAHSYRFSPELGTFVIECSPETWRRAGLDEATDAESRALCEEVFRDVLGGHGLVSNRSLWFNPQFVTSRNWHHGRVVLIGDALKTVHPSIGSGTRMALQDAIALGSALERCGEDVAATFALFEAERRSAAGSFQEAAMRSILWYETVDERMHLDPVMFAYDYMMRTGRVSDDRLRRIDPAFAERVERRRADAAAG